MLEWTNPAWRITVSGMQVEGNKAEETNGSSIQDRRQPGLVGTICTVNASAEKTVTILGDPINLEVETSGGAEGPGASDGEKQVYLQ